MDLNNLDGKDGDTAHSVVLVEAPSVIKISEIPPEGNVRKKRRRGKTKRKILKPFSKAPWQDRRLQDNTKRNNRYRKVTQVHYKTRAPFNNNQFLMEIHKPEPENNFQLLQTPSARTRDSSFSVDSEENYYFSLPDDEEEYLTKEFSSVYEDAQCERLSNMSKNELIQEYLLLEAKYDNLIKRSERNKTKDTDEEKLDKASDTEKDTMIIDASAVTDTVNEPSISDIMQRLREQEDKIRELQLANEKLVVENNHLRQHGQGSSEDSESDSSSSSDSCSSSSSCMSPVNVTPLVNGDITHDEAVQVNGEHNHHDASPPLVNGFHSPND